jgi:diguanylate cyclase
MDMLSLIGQPFLPVALAVVATIGYLVGLQRQRSAAAPEHEPSRRELKRAQAVVHDLEKAARRVRSELTQHETSLAAFKRRVAELSRQGSGGDWRLLCDEAERLLKPTQDLAMHLAHAYDGIHQQASRLMSFTGQRCDPLTGLCNRQALDETLENHLSMHRRYGVLFSLVVFDLDNFKRFNEEHGHLHGDRLLKQVAALLDQNARDTDVVTRYGGEEFIVVLPSVELSGASSYAERMRYTIDRLTALTVSGGVAAVTDGDDAKTLLTRADSALYAAKAAGRNRVYYHSGQSAMPCESEDLLAHDPDDAKSENGSDQRSTSDAGKPTAASV